MIRTACWCGNRDLKTFGDAYLECTCGTLMRARFPDDDIAHVVDEERDLYGKNYWFARQAELGLPDLGARSGSDLRERCLHWLRIVLAYKRPPARVLELGASHGGFVSLLGSAGFEATGIELSPWIVDYARRHTGARMLLGPVEDQHLEPSSFDLIVAFDVLEHLADPVRTLSCCTELLRDDGLLIVQTPCRPSDLDFSRACLTRFREMMIDEHLYLFSSASLRQLLCLTGLPGVVIEPSIFETDMTLVAGRRDVRRLDMPAIRSARNGDLPNALVDTLLFLREALDCEQSERRHQVEALEAGRREADADRDEMRRRISELDRLLAQADHDRTTRQQQLDALETRYHDADRDRTERLERLVEIERALAQADADRTERLQRIGELQRVYEEADRDRTERLQRISDLEAQFTQADRDRNDRLHRIAELEAELAQADRDRNGRLRRIEELEALFAQADCDRRKRLQRIRELEAQYTEADVDRTRWFQQLQDTELRYREADDDRRERLRQIEHVEAEKRTLTGRHEVLRALMADHRNSRVYRAMVRAGRWRRFEELLRPIVEETRPTSAWIAGATQDLRWTIPAFSPPAQAGAIAIDLTAILPGGENGGAKLVALELVRGLAAVAPSRQFVLLTSAMSHHEVASLEAPHVRRRLVDLSPTSLSAIVEEERIAAMLCPMTAAPFDDPRVPLVSLVHDLQFMTYPEFFDEAERHARHEAFNAAIRRSDHVVTPSRYVRASVLERSAANADDVTVVGHGFAQHRLRSPSERELVETLEKYGLRRGSYFIYPANFWAHKNHRMLLVAFGQLRERRPDLDVGLVLTGASRPEPRVVQDCVQRMGLTDRVLIPGYVPEPDLAALLSGALALVFPSLYEGFGMPLLEAFAVGCPVACSNVTSLPEVACQAALQFDPRKPGSIADALERLATDPGLRNELTTRGHQLLHSVDSSDRVARTYLDIVDRIAVRPRRARDEIAGLFTDGWTTSSVVVAHAGGAELCLEIENRRDVAVTLTAKGVEPISIGPHCALSLRCGLPPAGGHIAISVDPTFIPAECGPSSDTRRLGVQIRGCRLLRERGDTVDLLERQVHG